MYRLCLGAFFFSIFRSIVFVCTSYRTQASCQTSLSSLSVSLCISLSWSYTPTPLASRWKIKSNGGKVKKKKKERGKVKESCKGALCSLARVHTELHLNLLSGVGWARRCRTSNEGVGGEGVERSRERCELLHVQSWHGGVMSICKRAFKS